MRSTNFAISAQRAPFYCKTVPCQSTTFLLPAYSSCPRAYDHDAAALPAVLTTTHAAKLHQPAPGRPIPVARAGTLRSIRCRAASGSSRCWSRRACRSSTERLSQLLEIRPDEEDSVHAPTERDGARRPDPAEPAGRAVRGGQARADPRTRRRAIPTASASWFRTTARGDLFLSPWEMTKSIPRRSRDGARVRRGPARPARRA